MASRTSFVKTTLILFTKDQEENAEKLRTVLESECNGEVFVVDLVDISLCGLSLEDEMRQRCDCIVLICSSKATQLINEEKSSVFVTRGGQEAKFDGKVISKVLKDNDGKLRRKIIPVSFVELPSVLHGTRRDGRNSVISFEIKHGEVTEVMLEGDILQSLIDAIKKVKK
ncbi:uncharacterized protein LOC111321218 [Stylophora pistillata]|uniref:uncharacterized protein LOC111321218 n=1 Tax=Stylophora pistillata TaxID=50429 RepID=UPI000C03BBEF|nr:uncharacterized protein LOC111321218 [Stylophora pistillata]